MADSNVAIGSTGSNADTRTAPDGDHRQVVVLGDPTAASVATVNARGALLVQGPQSALASTNVTTSSSTTGAIACDGYNIAMVSIRGTYAGINLTWEISDDGTNWFPVQAQNDGTGAVGTTSGVLTANSSVSWSIPLGAATHFRVRSTAFTSGTGVLGVSLQTMPYEPIPSVFVQGTVPVSGTVTATASGTYTTNPTSPSASNINSAASTNATSVKGTAGAVFAVVAFNGNAAARYLKFYNKGSAPTVGTDVPIMVIELPAGKTTVVEFGTQGYRFTTGIALALTTGATDADTGAVAANEIKVATSYI